MKPSDFGTSVFIQDRPACEEALDTAAIALQIAPPGNGASLAIPLGLTFMRAIPSSLVVRGPRRRIAWRARVALMMGVCVHWPMGRGVDKSVNSLLWFSSVLASILPCGICSIIRTEWCYVS